MRRTARWETGKSIVYASRGCTFEHILCVCNAEKTFLENLGRQ